MSDSLSVEDALKKRPGAPPFTFSMVDARGCILRLHCTEVILAWGKHSVLRVFWQGREAAAKIYSGPRGLWKCRRGVRAHKMLHRAGLPTMEALHAVEDTDRRFALLLLAWLPDAVSVEEALKGAKNLTERMQLAEKMLDLMTTMHHHGLQQRDCHPGNFLFCGKRLYVADLETVRPICLRWTPVSNLIMMLNSLPTSMRPALLQLLEKKYRIKPPLWRLELQYRLGLRSLKRRMIRGDRNHFAIFRRRGRLIAYRRDLWFKPQEKIARTLEAAAAHGEVLEQTEGRRTVRAAEEYGGLILQCYDPPQGLRALRPSRAWQFWQNQHLLFPFARGDLLLPRALVCVEERRGPFRGRSWLALRLMPGESLAAVTREGLPPDSVNESLRKAFVVFYVLCALPQDLRANGFIVQQEGKGRVFFTALEDVRFFHRRSACRRAWPAMQQAFLSNWPASHPCHARYREMLEAIPRESPF